MRLFRSYGVNYRWTVRLTSVGIEIKKDRACNDKCCYRGCEITLAPWPWRRGF